KDYIHRVRRERGFGVNPWTTHSRFLISQRLLIDEAYASSLQHWLGTFRPGSLLILDEAHHAAPSSGQRYAIDSHITRAIRDLAPRFEHRLFLYSAQRALQQLLRIAGDSRSSAFLPRRQGQQEDAGRHHGPAAQG